MKRKRGEVPRLPLRESRPKFQDRSSGSQEISFHWCVFRSLRCASWVWNGDSTEHRVPELVNDIPNAHPQFHHLDHQPVMSSKRTRPRREPSYITQTDEFEPRHFQRVEKFGGQKNDGLVQLMGKSRHQCPHLCTWIDVKSGRDPNLAAASGHELANYCARRAGREGMKPSTIRATCLTTLGLSTPPKEKKPLRPFSLPVSPNCRVCRGPSTEQYNLQPRLLRRQGRPPMKPVRTRLTRT